MLDRSSFIKTSALLLLISFLCFGASARAQVVELLFPDVSASPGDTVCLDVRVNGFDSIAALQTTLSWDSSALALVSAESELPGLVFGEAAGGRLPITWTDFSGLTVTLPDSSRLFRFCFAVIAGELNEGSLDLGEEPVATEVTQFDGVNFIRLPVIQSGGAFRVVPCRAVQLGRDTALCPGDRLMVRVSSLAQVYEWRRDGEHFFPDIDFIADLPPGHTYTVGLQLSSSCRVADTIRIDEIPAPEVQLGIDASPVESSCAGYPLRAFGTELDSLRWLLDGRQLDNVPASEWTPTRSGALQVIAVEERCGRTDSSNLVQIVSPDTTRLNRTSCNPQDTGVIRQMFVNQSGCDSLVMITTTLALADTVRQIISTCNPQDTGTQVNLFTNQSGCDSVVILRTVISDTAACAPVVDLRTAAPLCHGEPTGRLTATVTRGAGPFTLELRTGDIALQTISAEAAGDPVRFEELSAGDYQLRVSDTRGQSSTQDVAIPEGAVLSLKVEAPPIDCNAGSTYLAVEAQGGLAPYLYSIDGGATFSGNSRIEDVGPGEYTVVVEDAQGCRSATRTFRVETPGALQIELGPDRRITLGDSVRLSFEGARLADSIRWSPAAGLSCTDCPAPVAAPLENTRYEVRIVDERGCEATDDILILVNRAADGVYLPNAFSPNGDNINDVYRVFPGKAVKQIRSLRIFDRWGNLLFESIGEEGEAFIWDGRFRGRDLPGGAYLAVLQVDYLDGRQATLSEEVQLLR